VWLEEMASEDFVRGVALAMLGLLVVKDRKRERGKTRGKCTNWVKS